MPNENNVNTGNAGEYFVAGELERRGFIVAVPMSNVENFVLSNGNELHFYESVDEPIVELHVINKYNKMWIQGKMPMQQLTKELIEKGIIPTELDYKSHEAVQLAIKYQKEEQEKNREKTQETIRILTEKRKNLPSINAPENYDKTSQELAEMGYLYEEIMWGEDVDMFK